MQTPEKKKILIADDDFYMRELAKVALANTAEIVETEFGGDKVVELYKQHKPAMLLLDIHMPQMDGKSTLKKILAHDPNAYVIMLSSDSSVFNIKETNGMGAKGFVAKPFTKESLLKYVRRHPDFK